MIFNKSLFKTICLLSTLTLTSCGQSFIDSSSSYSSSSSESRSSSSQEASSGKESSSSKSSQPFSSISSGSSSPYDESLPKVGLITLHGSYSLNDLLFINALRREQVEMKFPYVIKEDIPEGIECYDAICGLIDEGCDIIITNSFGHDAYTEKAAKENPNVLFANYSGTKSDDDSPNHYHFYIKEYEARFIEGLAAGCALVDRYGDENDMLSNENAKVGFVGAYTYAECISSYTAFYLGVKAAIPYATMEVKFTGSWYDETREKMVAEELIARGAKVLANNSISYATYNAASSRNILYAAYNLNCEYASDLLFSIDADFGVYFKKLINHYDSKVKLAKEYAGGFSDGCFGGYTTGILPSDVTAELDFIIEMLTKELIHPFETSRMSINGEKLTEETVKPQPMTYTDFTGTLLDKGYYHECEYRSAPYFDVEIDGITLLNRVY